MTHKALIYSVPGSGTMFTRTLLEKGLEYKQCGIDQVLAQKMPWKFAQIHSYDSEREKAYDQRDLKTIIPIRDPISTFLTRHNNLGGGYVAREQVLSHWLYLIATIDRFDYVLLPVAEDFDRRTMLQRVVDHLEAPIKGRAAFENMIEEWPKVNTQGDRTMRPEYEQTGRVENRPLKFLDGAREWYERQLIRYERETLA